MHAAVRPWVTSGVALVGASVIAVTPIAPPPPTFAPQAHIPELHVPAVQLSASVVDIFTFPALRQFILNRIDDIVTLGVGFAGSAAGLGHSIAQLLPTLVTTAQQVLSGDLLGALTTVETYLVGSIVAVGGPTLAAIIERRQRYLAVREALQVAVPQAIIDVVAGFGGGADTVLRAFIVAGQNLVDAVLSFNPGAIVSAIVDGTTLVLGSVAEGGQQVVDGIVSAQQTIATALASQPDPTVTALSATVASQDVTDLPDLSRKTAMISVSPSSDTTNTADAKTVDATDTEPTDTVDAETLNTNKEPSVEVATAESKATEGSPKAKDDADQTTAKDSANTSKPDNSAPQSPKADTGPKKDDDSPKHENKKDDNNSQSEGAEK